jgi:hypothetical protein
MVADRRGHSVKGNPLFFGPKHPLIPPKHNIKGCFWYKYIAREHAFDVKAQLPKGSGWELHWRRPTTTER